MAKKNDPRETAAVRAARARLEQKILDETGSTGRVTEDRRAAHGVRVELRIPVDEIREEGTRVKERLPAAWVTDTLADPAEEPWTAGGDAEIDLTLTRDETVRVKGLAHFDLLHTCVRCLEPIPFELDLDLDLRLVRSEDLGGVVPDDVALDYGLSDALSEPAETLNLEEGEVAAFDGRTVDLGAVLREQIFLELPMHPSCESEGARPEGPCVLDREGALAKEQERWVDPRWAGLMALKDRLQS